jgi:CRISPR-associated protein Csb3
MNPQPTHTYNIDLTNPGQFLACCGLLELATCLDAAAMGWFETDAFHLHAVANGAATLVEQFIRCPATPVSDTTPDDDDDDAEKSPPLLLGGSFKLSLNWWTDPTAVRAGFKTWSGGQTVLGFFDGMRQHIAQQSLDGPELLTRAISLKKPKPFYFDGRLSSLTSIAMGFSAEDFAATYSPAVEALALVGLQRFRPETVTSREEYAFSTWTEPLPASIASAVVHGLIEPLTSNRFQFPFVVRTGGKYKAFGHALPKRSNAHG